MLNFLGRKDLSNDTQIRVIDPVEPEISTKVLKMLSKKLGAKFPATTCGYSMTKFPDLMMLSRNLFNWKQAQLKVNLVTAAKRKNKKNTFDFTVVCDFIETFQRKYPL